MSEKKLYSIRPIYEERMWGGRQLIEKYHLDTKLEKIAEIYCVIAIPDHLDCIVEETGEYLSAFYKEHPQVFECDKDELPVRVVLGSAKDPLSVQIHPDDEYGMTHSGMRGKHEGELILDGKPDGWMVLGHYAKTREEFIELVEKGEWDRLLKRINIKSGDYIHIPYNTLHGGAGEGTCVAFSTNGDVTYRLYDYDRIDPSTGKKRKLNVQDVFNKVIVPCDDIGAIDYERRYEDDHELDILYDVPGLYTAGRIRTDEGCEYERDEFWFVTCIEGEGKIEGHPIKGAVTYLVPAGYGPVRIEGKLDLVFISYRNNDQE